MTYVEQVVQWLRDRLAREPSLADPRELNVALRVLAIWRSRAIADAYVRHYGARIMQGPFAGMEYVTSATEGALTPRLIGTYESELHPYLATFAAKPLDCVIDVGCAEGYYAVGLARLMPGVTVHAFDIQEKARLACAELAAKNGVTDRVIIGERFEPDGFEAFKDRRCLVLVDIEGAEDDLLRPDLSPALAGMDLIVETHDVYRGACWIAWSSGSARRTTSSASIRTPRPCRCPTFSRAQATWTNCWRSGSSASRRPPGW